MWFAVVYFIIKGDPSISKKKIPLELCTLQPQTVLKSHQFEQLGERMLRLSELLPLLENHMKYRLLHRSSFASLSGLSQFVCTKVPLATAVWHVLHSGFAKPSPSADPLRMHIRHVPMFMQLLCVV